MPPWSLFRAVKVFFANQQVNFSQWLMRFTNYLLKRPNQLLEPKWRTTSSASLFIFVALMKRYTHVFFNYFFKLFNDWLSSTRRSRTRASFDSKCVLFINISDLNQWYDRNGVNCSCKLDPFWRSTQSSDLPKEERYVCVMASNYLPRSQSSNFHFHL